MLPSLWVPEVSPAWKHHSPGQCECWDDTAQSSSWGALWHWKPGELKGTSADQSLRICCVHLASFPGKTSFYFFWHIYSSVAVPHLHWYILGNLVNNSLGLLLEQSTAWLVESSELFLWLFCTLRWLYNDLRCHQSPESQAQMYLTADEFHDKWKRRPHPFAWSVLYNFSTSQIWNAELVHCVEKE